MGFQIKQFAILSNQIRRGCFLWSVVWLAMSSGVIAKPMLDTGDPVGFFTTVADKMLRSTFSFGVTNIPVYTNGVFVYSPSVQRLLQLSANILDATTNRASVFGKDYSSVFRPIFTATASGDLFITGYSNVVSVSNATDIALSTPIDAATVAAAGGTNMLVNVYGVPWIIGAKKGFPNFNQFNMLAAVRVTRKLQITKPYFGAQPDLFQTNQMYIFSITNSLTCSLWNSYTSAYSGNLTLIANDRVSMIMTNDAPGFVAPQFNNFPAINTVTTLNSWSGTSWWGNPPSSVMSPDNSSLIPFNATAVLLANSIYRYAGYAGNITIPGPPGFDSYNGDYQTNVNTPQLPHFVLLATNRLQMVILDTDTNSVSHVIDYVQLAGPEISIDVNTNLADPDYSSSLDMPAYVWSTNGGFTPAGVLNQIYVSEVGGPPPPNSGGAWFAYPNLPAGVPATPDAEKAFFTGFLNYNRVHYGVYVYNGKFYTNTNLTVQVPYTPTRTIYNFTSWQANDPLVHYLASDLTYNNPGVIGTKVTDDPLYGMPSVSMIATNVNIRYSPWGVGYPYPNVSQAVDATWQMQMKDPLAWRSDNWNFPAGQDWSLSALGRVHRGTPWQTVYLKTSDIKAAANGPASWAQWTGNPDSNDAILTAPINDWQLMGLLIPLLNTNDPTQLMSVNDLNLTNWLNALNGFVVLTNSGTGNYAGSAQFDSDVMAGNSAQALFIANAIAQTRTNRPNQNFQNIGDVLQTPAIAENSPWLNWNDSAQQQYGISDEAYEAIPAQLLPLLRPDSIGAMIPTNGGWNILFSGSDAYTYVLQTSPDLINWTVVSTNNPGQGSFSHPIFQSSSSKIRFYRTMLLP